MPIEPLSTILAYVIGISAIILIPFSTICLIIFFIRMLKDLQIRFLKIPFFTI